MKIIKLIIVLLLFPISAFSQQEELIEKAMTTEKYSILTIMETKRFYLLTATKKYTKGILLVIEKNSEQLKGKKPKIGKKYKFNTYSIFDVMHRNANLSHYVDGERIWIYKDGIDLRFTDSMGDAVLTEIKIAGSEERGETTGNTGTLTKKTVRGHTYYTKNAKNVTSRYTVNGKEVKIIYDVINSNIKNVRRQ